MEYKDSMFSDEEISLVLYLEACYNNRENIAAMCGLRLAEVNDIINKYEE